MVMSKRTVSATVKMTSEDDALLTKAAESIWPGAILTKSSVILGLAKIAAADILKSTKKK
jgi:hypothetical protein